MSQSSVTSQSTWRSKIKAMGPGILMASAAVGGSHIVSSTQAGGKYGWALLGLVILANLFKYPFFRFGAEYTADTGKTLVEGYAEKGKFYLWVFFILNVFSALVNTAGVAILCAAIIASAFPMLGLTITVWSFILVAIIWGMLLFGGYKLLDGMAKWIMSALTIATVAAVIIAAIKHPEYSADFVEKTPWQLAALPFIVSALFHSLLRQIKVVCCLANFVKGIQIIAAFICRISLSEMDHALQAERVNFYLEQEGILP